MIRCYDPPLRFYLFVAAIACGIAFIACGQRGPLAVMPEPSIYATTERVTLAINEAAGERIVAIGVEPGSTVWIYGDCGHQRWNEIHAAPSCEKDPEAQAVVLVHEIGHALMGPEHSADRESVMFAKYHARPLDDAARSLVEELRR